MTLTSTSTSHEPSLLQSSQLLDDSQFPVFFLDSQRILDAVVTASFPVRRRRLSLTGPSSTSLSTSCRPAREKPADIFPGPFYGQQYLLPAFVESERACVISFESDYTFLVQFDRLQLDILLPPEHRVVSPKIELPSS